MNDRVIRVMQEAGIDISHHRSKHVDELRGINFDYIITVCDHANETCPTFPFNARRLHMGFEDPPRLAKNASTEQEALSHYRRVRDQIKEFVQSWNPPRLS